MENLTKHMELMGLKVEDKVTSFTGVVVTICFDLYGCIQAAVHPGLDDKGGLRDPIWLDVTRLRILDSTPVMERPEFDWSPQVISAAGKGPAERPAHHKP